MLLATFIAENMRALADEYPEIGPEHVFLNLLKLIGVPFVVLCFLNLLFGVLAWKEAARKATDSYRRANSFVQRERKDLAWQVPVLGTAQALFIAAAYCAAQLVSFLAHNNDGYVHEPMQISEWASIATSVAHMSELTKTVTFIAVCIALAIDFLVVTERADMLEHAHGIVTYAPGSFLFGSLAALFAFIGLLTSYDGDPAHATGYYISAGMFLFCWGALITTAFAAREFADS